MTIEGRLSISSKQGLYFSQVQPLLCNTLTRVLQICFEILCCTVWVEKITNLVVIRKPDTPLRSDSNLTRSSILYFYHLHHPKASYWFSTRSWPLILPLKSQTPKYLKVILIFHILKSLFPWCQTNLLYLTSKSILIAANMQKSCMELSLLLLTDSTTAFYPLNSLFFKTDKKGGNFIGR